MLQIASKTLHVLFRREHNHSFFTAPRRDALQLRLLVVLFALGLLAKLSRVWTRSIS